MNNLLNLKPPPAQYLSLVELVRITYMDDQPLSIQVSLLVRHLACSLNDLDNSHSQLDHCPAINVAQGITVQPTTTYQPRELHMWTLPVGEMDHAEEQHLVPICRPSYLELIGAGRLDG